MNRPQISLTIIGNANGVLPHHCVDFDFPI
jgi:hypothetical protein